MKVELEFHNTLVKYTNTKTHTLEVSKFSELISALKNVFPKLDMYFNEIMSGKAVDNICFLDNAKNIIKDSAFTLDIITSKSMWCWWKKGWYCFYWYWYCPYSC